MKQIFPGAGPTLNQQDKLLPIGARAGVIYSWLFKYTQQYTTSLHWVSVRPNAGFVSRDGGTFQTGTVATVVYGQDFRNIAQQPLIKMGSCICQPGTHWPSLLVEPWGHGIRYQYPVHVFVSNSTSKFKFYRFQNFHVSVLLQNTRSKLGGSGKVCCSWGTSGTRRVTAKRHELVLGINIEIPLNWR